MPDAFVSYSRSDSKELVVRLRDALEAAGHDVWVDLEDIPPASPWQEELRGGIAQSDSFVFVISPGSVRSEHCLRELAHAVALHKRIIPINHVPTEAGSIPEEISTLHWIPGQGLFGDDFDGSLALLVEAIETDLDWVRQHTRWGNLATAWEKKGHDRSLLVRGSELEDAERWLSEQSEKDPEPTDLQRRFILESRRNATRRGRIVFAAVAVALAVSVGLGIAALLQRNEAISEKTLAIARGREATSRELAANSLRTLVSNPALSLRLAVRAVAEARTRQAVNSLRQSLQASNPPRTFRIGSRVATSQFGPSGRTVLIAGADGVARIWNVESGEQVRAMRSSAPLRDAEFDPDRRLAITAGADGFARIWRATTGRQLRTLVDPSHQPLVRAAFSPDGRSVVTASRDADLVRWRLADGTPLLRWHSPSAINDLAISPDGRTAVTAGSDGAARLWDLTTGRVRALLRGSGAVLKSVAFSPDGKEIATGGDDDTVRVWRLGRKRPIRTFRAPYGYVWAVAFSPDGRSVGAGFQASSAVVWDLGSRQQTAVVHTHQGIVWDVGFSPDGRSLVTASSDGGSRVWSLRARSAVQLGGPGRKSFPLATLSPDARLAATAGSGGPLTIWDATSGRRRATLRANAIEDIRFSPDSREVAISEADGVVRVGDSRSGAEVRVLRGHHGGAYGLGWSPDGRRLACGGDDGRVTIWSLGSGRPQASLPMKGRGAAEWAAFDPGGGSLAVGYADGSTVVWGLASNSPRAALVEPQPYPIYSLAYSPRRGLLATQQEAPTPTIGIWRAASGKRISSLAPPPAPEDSVAFSPNGRSVVSGLENGTIWVWDAASGRDITTIRAGRAEVASARFVGGHGDRLASISTDGVVQHFACPVCSASIGRLLRLARRELRQFSASRGGNGE